MRLYSQKDVDKKALRGARIAILGYGSQGRAHALNLHDSGFDVVVGTRKGDSWKKARKDGLHVMEPKEAVKGAKLIAMLVPDMTQKALYDELKGDFEKGSTLLFAHGFNVHFKQIKPRKDMDVVLIAPKGPGDLVRRQYQQGRGVPCLIAVAQNPSKHAKANALAYADGKPTCSASRRCCAAERRNWSSRVTRRWWKRATSPPWPTTSACTS
jgi:ketol-acid reductoisomerase